jgi:hypothetical protein
MSDSTRVEDIAAEWWRELSFKRSSGGPAARNGPLWPSCVEPKGRSTRSPCPRRSIYIAGCEEPTRISVLIELLPSR